MNGFVIDCEYQMAAVQLPPSGGALAPTTLASSLMSYAAPFGPISKTSFSTGLYRNASFGPPSGAYSQPTITPERFTP